MIWLPLGIGRAFSGEGRVEAISWTYLQRRAHPQPYPQHNNLTAHLLGGLFHLHDVIFQFLDQQTDSAMKIWKDGKSLVTFQTALYAKRFLLVFLPGRCLVVYHVISLLSDIFHCVFKQCKAPYYVKQKLRALHLPRDHVHCLRWTHNQHGSQKAPCTVNTH